MSLIKVGNFTIDTGFNEPAFANPQSWTYAAKVEPLTGTDNPAQPQNIALYNWHLNAQVLRGKTFYTSGSTSFPNNYGERRIYIVVEAWIEFIRSNAFWNSVQLTSVNWQLVRTT